MRSQLSTCTLGNKGRPFFDDVRRCLALQCFIERREQIHHTGGFTVELGRGLHPSNLVLRDWDLEKRKQHVLITYGTSITTSILMHFGRRAAKDEAPRFAVEPELDEVASKMHQLGSCLHSKARDPAGDVFSDERDYTRGKFRLEYDASPELIEGDLDEKSVRLAASFSEK